MKRLFTFLIILTFGLSVYAQKPAAPSQKAVAFADKIAVDAQALSIDKVYPNPVKDYLIVDLTAATPGAVELSLINILGTEVKKWNEFSLNQSNQKIKLDLSEFKSGVYILKVTKQDQVRTQVLKKN